MTQAPGCLLSINNYFYPRGGAEVLFLEQNRMLESIGWQVVPFAMRHADNLPTPWAEYFPTRSSSAAATAWAPSC